MSVTSAARLAGFVSDARTLPAAVIERAQRHIADTLACLYAGTASQAVRLMRRVSVAPEAAAPVVVPGLGRWRDPALAALLAGLCAHADDFDDTSEYSMNGHPSAPVVSALIPTACLTDASGADVVRAYAVGVEVACKLGLAVGESHTRRGWHTMSTLGALGAAAAAANLRGLSRAQTERALAIACSFAGGLLGNTGTMTKALHCGRAAQAGYLSAALAQQGFTAGADILETEGGFLDALTDRAVSRIEWGALGEPWDLVAPGFAIKLYPCCSCTHLCIDAALALRGRHAFALSAIESVHCTVREECTHYLRFPAPRTAVEAKFSLHYVVAAALARGAVRLDDFEAEALERPDVTTLMHKLHVAVAGPGEKEGRVEVRLADGRRFALRRDAARGSPDDPVEWDDIGAKLKDGMAKSGVLSRVDANAHVAALREMSRAPRFSSLLIGGDAEVRP
ncbi:MmgE/PrpD family protein [Paraburkholderia sp. J41]|uniref:MmgE/PrpD family protein n=1 Tax=Paraburkholderia sp. J41 TaxID=2805433 RepID=UPI002AC316EC|nr:MmgE/PrpD family protein [Paraburkholderia sp. J41]